MSARYYSESTILQMEPGYDCVSDAWFPQLLAKQFWLYGLVEDRTSCRR